MRKDIYKSKRTKRTEITSWALIVVVVLALLSPFIYRKVLVRDSVTEYKELLVITKGKAKKADSGYNQNEYYGAAEPPVRCGESHLSGLTEPPHFVY